MRMATHLSCSSEKPCPILYCSMILTYTKAERSKFLYASKSSMKLVALMYVQLMLQQQQHYLIIYYLGLKDAWKWLAVQTFESICCYGPEFLVLCHLSVIKKFVTRKRILGILEKISVKRTSKYFTLMSLCAKNFHHQYISKPSHYFEKGSNDCADFYSLYWRLLSPSHLAFCQLLKEFILNTS